MPGPPLREDPLTIDPASLSPRERSRLMLGLVVPRPIAWVSTRGADGSTNLAPMSFFNAMQVSPMPVLAFGVGTRTVREGDRERIEKKDTLRNILETREFVVNLVTEATAEAMVRTSGDYPYGVSEFEAAGVAAAPSDVVKPPRVAGSPVAFECRLFEALPLTRSRRAEDVPHDTLVLGEVVRVHVAGGVLDAEFHADVERLRPVARLGGTEYWRRGEVFRMERPRVSRAPGAGDPPSPQTHK